MHKIHVIIHNVSFPVASLHYRGAQTRLKNVVRQNEQPEVEASAYMNFTLFTITENHKIYTRIILYDLRSQRFIFPSLKVFRIYSQRLFRIIFLLQICFK